MHLVRSKVVHEPGYVIVIHIHVLPDGQARIQYDGDLSLASSVLTKTKKLLEEEMGKKRDGVVKSKGKFTGIGEKKNGVLSEVTVMEE